MIKRGGLMKEKKLPNIIFLGAPGSGKGTVAKQLVQKYNYLHLSTGDLFRETIGLDTQLADKIRLQMQLGKLIDDETTNAMIKGYLDDAIASNKHFILDGYPRTIDQAEFLKTVCDIDLVIYLDIEQNIAIKRITGRRNCPGCGEIYNTFFKKPQRDEICDKCNTHLLQRKDDNIETAISRFHTYQDQTSPLIAYYEKANKLVTIKVEEGTSDIFTQVCKIIEGK
jgi:adenylate kinase